jgi:hypothetical protein
MLWHPPSIKKINFGDSLTGQVLNLVSNNYEFESSHDQ